MKIIATLILFTFINYPIFGQLKTNTIPKENNINLFSEYNSTNDTVNKNKNDNIKNKLFNIDFNSWDLSFGYAERIKKSRWFIGAGGGFAFVAFADILFGWEECPYYSIGYVIDSGWIFRNYSLKESLHNANALCHLRGFVIFLKSNHFILETGIRASVNDIQGSEDEYFIPGYYVMPMFGWRNFKTGILIDNLLIGAIYFAPFIRITL